MKISTRISIPEDIALFDLNKITQITNAVYLESESEFWGNDYTRITPRKLEALVKRGQIIWALENENVVGWMNFGRHKLLGGRFEMLVTLPEFRKKGIGNKLVEAAENQAIKQGFQFMYLELLEPATGEHPDKIFLRKWYQSKGYCLQSQMNFFDQYPHLEKIGKIKLCFSLYKKILQNG